MILKHKWSNTKGLKPSSLSDGEIAINQKDKKIFISDGGDGVVAIGGESADNAVTLDTEQTITGKKTFDNDIEISKPRYGTDTCITMSNEEWFPSISAYYKQDYGIYSEHDGLKLTFYGGNGSGEGSNHIKPGLYLSAFTEGYDGKRNYFLNGTKVLTSEDLGSLTRDLTFIQNRSTWITAYYSHDEWSDPTKSNNYSRLILSLDPGSLPTQNGGLYLNCYYKSGSNSPEILKWSGRVLTENDLGSIGGGNTVTLDTEQTITGEKTFSEQVLITNDYWGSKSSNPNITLTNRYGSPKLRAYYNGNGHYMDLTFNGWDSQLYLSAYYRWEDGQAIFENRRVLTEKDLENVVTLGTNQEITGEKTFSKEVLITNEKYTQDLYDNKVKPNITLTSEYTFPKLRAYYDGHGKYLDLTLDSQQSKLYLSAYYRGTDGPIFEKKRVLTDFEHDIKLYGSGSTGYPRIHAYYGATDEPIETVYFTGSSIMVEDGLGNSNYVQYTPTFLPFGGVIKKVNLVEAPIDTSTFKPENLYFLQEYGCFGYGTVSLDDETSNSETLSFKLTGTIDLWPNPFSTEDVNEYGGQSLDNLLIPYGSGISPTILQDSVSFNCYNIVNNHYLDNRNFLTPLFEVNDGDYILENGNFINPQNYKRRFGTSSTKPKIIGCVIDAKKHLFVANDPTRFIYGKALCPMNNDDNMNLANLGLDLANSCDYNQTDKILYNQIEYCMNETDMETNFPCLYTHFTNNRNYKMGKSYFPTVNEIFKIGKQISHINYMYDTPHVESTNSEIKNILAELSNGEPTSNLATIGTITPVIPSRGIMSTPITRESFITQVTENEGMQFYGFNGFIGDSYNYATLFKGDKTDVLYIMLSVYE